MRKQGMESSTGAAGGKTYVQHVSTLAIMQLLISSTLAIRSDTVCGKDE